MDVPSNLTSLERWVKDNGGYLNPQITTAYSEEKGAHMRAKADIESTTMMTIVPHSLALSCLNALVDDAWPVFKQRRKDFMGVENIGFFYLIVQRIHLERSFWRPYISSLPRPTESFTTPLWFDSDEDLTWLKETDVLYTMLGRKAIYEKYYSCGIDILRQAGVDTAPYTWDLFRWAVTMFTSRSFSSRAITPQESKYWTTYKNGAQGGRQTVLMDMSHAPSEDLDFPVLFPLHDVANHSYDAHVDWTFDPGRFSITLNDRLEAGAEVLNNYGTKGNDELLLGYGFCIPGSVHDSVMLTLKPPPEDLQNELRTYQPGYFKMPDKTWNSEKATFRIKLPHVSVDDQDPEHIFSELPTSLLELLTYILCHERGLSFTTLDHPLDYLTSPEGSCYLPHVARMIVQSLMPKLAKLEAIELPSSPKNEKQRYASIYRTGQLNIFRATIASLRTFTRSLLRPVSVPGRRFVTLEGFLDLWSHHSTGSESPVAAFLRGIEANAGTQDIAQLRMAGWEDDVFVLALCAAVVEGSEWMSEALPDYARYTRIWAGARPATEAEKDLQEHAQDLRGIVRTAAAAADDPASHELWADADWSVPFIATIGKMLLYDSMTMMVPSSAEGGSEEARLVVYLHAHC